MDSSQIEQHPHIVYSESNKRRVTKCAQQIYPHNEDNQKFRFLLCGDSMYGSSLMDGKIKVIQVDENGGCSEKHYMETTWGVCAISFF